MAIKFERTYLFKTKTTLKDYHQLYGDHLQLKQSHMMGHEHTADKATCIREFDILCDLGIVSHITP